MNLETAASFDDGRSKFKFRHLLSFGFPPKTRILRVCVQIKGTRFFDRAGGSVCDWVDILTAMHSPRKK